MKVVFIRVAVSSFELRNDMAGHVERHTIGFLNIDARHSFGPLVNVEPVIASRRTTQLDHALLVTSAEGNLAHFPAGIARLFPAGNLVTRFHLTKRHLFSFGNHDGSLFAVCCSASDVIDCGLYPCGRQHSTYSRGFKRLERTVKASEHPSTTVWYPRVTWWGYRVPRRSFSLSVEKTSDQ